MRKLVALTALSFLLASCGFFAEIFGIGDDGFGQENGFEEEIIQASSPITGHVTGLAAGVQATVTLGNDEYLESQTVTADEMYAFTSVPAGLYFLKIESVGYTGRRAYKVSVSDYSRGAGRSVGSDGFVFEMSPLDEDVFTFHWESDFSRSGYQTTSHRNSLPTITFLNEEIEDIDVAAADKLRHSYNILLADDEVAWNQEYA